MSVVVVGMNHTSAALEIRERLAFDSSNIPEALGRLKAMDPKGEFVLLSTCNRVEVYCASECERQGAIARLIDFLSCFHGIEAARFERVLYSHADADAVRHLLRVSAGLDSMVLGEAQILGQVKDSYKLACAAKSTGKILNRLFHCAFFTAKSIHTATGISTGRVSVASVAVEMAVQLFADLSRATVVVLGAGETGELVVQNLLKKGCKDVTVLNRSYERGQRLARRWQIAARQWKNLAEEIGKANIVISSAAARNFLCTRAVFEKVAARKNGEATLIIDVGVPRNFEPSIGEMKNVYLYSIDQLKQVAEENLKARREDLNKCLEIVYENAAEFMDWLRARDIGPLIGRMRTTFREIGQEELNRFFVGPRQDACCRALMETTVNRVVNKLLHCIITNVNTVAKEAGPVEATRLVDTILEQAREISCEARKERQVEV